ncbi:hypothetical protein OG232_18440 [Streptomyces sp. NBC_01411]|uniref:hypothetical protein n=1 Tax=Streptomyces sp. NBC_01411 TaxID=2903857 RepID=UPI003244384F
MTATSSDRGRRIDQTATGASAATSASSDPVALIPRCINDQANPSVVEATEEAGIGIAGQKPKVLTIEAVQASDYVITVGCSAGTAMEEITLLTRFARSVIVVHHTCRQAVTGGGCAAALDAAPPRRANSGRARAELDAVPA